jgi:hypothetical protein
VTFTPITGWSGTVSIPYTVKDLYNQIATANITVTLSGGLGTSPNLILNPSVELGTLLPTNWLK